MPQSFLSQKLFFRCFCLANAAPYPGALGTSGDTSNSGSLHQQWAGDRSGVFELRSPAAGPFSCFHMSGFQVWNDSVGLLPRTWRRTAWCGPAYLHLHSTGSKVHQIQFTQDSSFNPQEILPGEAVIFPPMWSVTGIFLLLQKLTNWPFPESR